MARLARVEVFASDEIAIVHVVNRTVRRCYLMGNDPLTGKNFDHRKAWMETKLLHLAKNMGMVDETVVSENRSTSQSRRQRSR